MNSSSVFISYRRDASAFMARAIFQDLRAHGIDAFMDVENIDSGHFDEIILHQIAARPYFLLILTPGTLERCVEPGDWVRREIESALHLKRIIIPLTTPNFNFADARPFLPGPLAELTRFNGVDVPHHYFDEAMERLRKRFLKPVDLPVTPTPEIEEGAVASKLDLALAAQPVTSVQLSAQDYYERMHNRPYDDLSGRIDDLTEALRINPEFIVALHVRGGYYTKAKRYNDALADFSRIIAIDPNNGDAYYERGILQDNIDDGIRDYTEAIRLNAQTTASAYIRRGFAYRNIGDVARALPDLRQGLALEPNHPLAPIIANYIQIYMKQAENPQADQDDSTP